MRRCAFLVWAVHRGHTFRALAVHIEGRRDEIVLEQTASVGEVVGWRACLRFCRFALSADELEEMAIVRLIVPIDLVQRCAARRGSCTLM